MATLDREKGEQIIRGMSVRARILLRRFIALIEEDQRIEAMKELHSADTGSRSEVMDFFSVAWRDD